MIKVYKSCMTYLKYIYLDQCTFFNLRSDLLEIQIITCYKQGSQCIKDENVEVIDAIDQLGICCKDQETICSIFYLEFIRASIDKAKLMKEVIETVTTKILPNDYMIDSKIILNEPLFIDGDLHSQQASIAEHALLALIVNVKVKSALFPYQF